MLHDLGYADDAAFIADALDKLVHWARQLRGHYNSWGLVLSVDKTEALTSQPGVLPPNINLDPSGRSSVRFTKSFKYLGAVVTPDGQCAKDIIQRIDLARKAFWRLASSVWNVSQLSLHTKIRVYRSCVLSVLLYGAESWTTTFVTRRQLEQFQMTCLRKITKGSPLGDTLSLSCEASVGTSGSNN